MQGFAGLGSGGHAEECAWSAREFSLKGSWGQAAEVAKEFRFEGSLGQGVVAMESSPFASHWPPSNQISPSFF